MEALAILSAVLGLPLVTGLNLYATILTAGLLQRLGLISLPPQLEVLGSEWIIGVAAILYLIEFFADKVPWVDSAWDAVHTFIRVPAGAALALMAVGDVHPVVQICAFLLGGSLALASHSAKAGVRLAVNTSPEPVTNIGLSLVEDVAVACATWLVFANPVVMILLVLIFLVGFVVCIHKVLQAARYLMRKFISLFRRRKVVQIS